MRGEFEVPCCDCFADEAYCTLTDVARDRFGAYDEAALEELAWSTFVYPSRLGGSFSTLSPSIF